MATKKLRKHIATGLWCKRPISSIVTTVYKDIGQDGESYLLKKILHGEVFEWLSFDTLDELEAAMRLVDHDLRRWKLCDPR